MKDKLSAFWNGFKNKWNSLAKNLRIFIITAGLGGRGWRGSVMGGL